MRQFFRVVLAVVFAGTGVVVFLAVWRPAVLPKKVVQTALFWQRDITLADESLGYLLTLPAGWYDHCMTTV